ncbi:MAG: 2Fe-2S iron-sulfur cluster-binding protein [Spirochaetia bacterium]|nr:2Fe-2S iron-sulfur cluster-binding protein [Spirochaetia bacterium]
MLIKFILNKKQVAVDADPMDSLSEILRTKFSIDSVNECCNTGRCGGCTVLKNNLPVPSCMIHMFTVRNANILTFEHIKTTREYSIIDKTLKTYNCIFCDYCSTGRIITIYSLLKNSDKLNNDDIYRALSGNICNCTDLKTMTIGIRLAFNALKRGR